MTDPIADMLTRIRNALAVNKPEVEMPHSKMKAKIAEIMKEYGYIQDYEEVSRHKKKFLRIVLKYTKPHHPAIHHLKRISKPGRRMYVKKNNLPHVLNNYGIAIISTSQGLMTNIEARKRKLGGEIICEIY